MPLDDSTKLMWVATHDNLLNSCSSNLHFCLFVFPIQKDVVKLQNQE